MILNSETTVDQGQCDFVSSLIKIVSDLWQQPTLRFVVN